MSSGKLAVCEHCDAVYERQTLAPGEVATCVRCGAELYRNRRFGLDTMLALTLTGLMVFVLANVYPIVEIELQGTRNAAGLWGAIVAAYDSGVGVVAVVAAATVFFFPLLQLLLLAYVLVPLRNGEVPRGFVWAMHALRHMQPWSMVEVFVLGVLVAVVKLVGLATVIPGVGLWSFAALTVLLTAVTSFNLHHLWDIAAEQQA